MRYCPLENGLEVWKTDAWIGRKGPNLQEVGGQPASNLHSNSSWHIAALTTQSGLLNVNRIANCRITSAGYLDFTWHKIKSWYLKFNHTNTHTTPGSFTQYNDCYKLRFDFRRPRDFLSKSDYLLDCLLQIQWAPKALYSKAVRLDLKIDPTSALTTEVMNSLSYISIHTHVFMPWCLLSIKTSYFRHVSSPYGLTAWNG
jgi:hypothetical protein